MNEHNELIQRYRALAQRVLDRIVSDPHFGQRLLENPREALEAAGLLQEVEELSSAMQASAEVAGYQRRLDPLVVGCTHTCSFTCAGNTCAGITCSLLTCGGQTEVVGRVRPGA